MSSPIRLSCRRVHLFAISADDLAFIYGRARACCDAPRRCQRQAQCAEVISRSKKVFYTLLNVQALGLSATQSSQPYRRRVMLERCKECSVKEGRGCTPETACTTEFPSQSILCRTLPTAVMWLFTSLDDFQIQESGFAVSGFIRSLLCPQHLPGGNHYGRFNLFSIHVF